MFNSTHIIYETFIKQHEMEMDPRPIQSNKNLELIYLIGLGIFMFFGQHSFVGSAQVI